MSDAVCFIVSETQGNCSDHTEGLDFTYNGYKIHKSGLLDDKPYFTNINYYNIIMQRQIHFLKREKIVTCYTTFWRGKYAYKIVAA